MIVAILHIRKSTKNKVAWPNTELLVSIIVYLSCLRKSPLQFLISTSQDTVKAFLTSQTHALGQS